MIIKSVWSKQHVLEGINKLINNPYMVINAPQFDVYEWGVYRGGTTQLIQNVLKGFGYKYNHLWGIDSFEGLPCEPGYVERFYLFDQGMFADTNESMLSPLDEKGDYIKAWFKDITKENVQNMGWKPASFIHVDGDLYISCIDTMTVMLENNLIVPGTIITFDEFKSTETLEAGGESRAMFEICDKYKLSMTEFFRNVYFDRLECWQNCFEVNSIGEKSECKLL